MTVSSASNIIVLSFFLILVLNIVQGTLTPNGNISVDCGSTQTFTCAIPGKPIKWTTSGLRGISRGPFLARTEAIYNSRMWSPDHGGDAQVGESRITISGFSISDNGGTIQCINANNSNVRGMTSISVASLPLSSPTNVTATVESCYVTLQWTQPSEPNEITSSVSCTPPSPGCAECITSPCTIIGLNPSTEYVFTVTLNSGPCRANMSTTTARTIGLHAPCNVVLSTPSCDTVTLQWTQPSEPDDITTSVSCTPPSPGCAECTTSPCTITGLSPSTEYVFSVTLNSGGCRASMSTTIITKDYGLPSCPSSVVAFGKGGNNAITVTWEQPPNTPPVTSTTVTYCPTSSPYCGNSMTCTSPCTISGLYPGTEYQFTVIPNNNCGSPTGCTGNTATVETACKIACPTCTCPPTPLLAGLIPTVMLLLANVVTGVVVFLITRHCYKKTSQKSSSKDEDVYEQVEGPKTYEDIVLTDSPAYGPMK